MKTRQPYLAFSLLALLSACSTGLHINTPPLPHTQNYLSKKDAIPLHQQMELGKQIDASWWRLFGSGTLDHLIQQSLKTNYTLASARNTLMQAREAVKAEQGIAYPQVSLGFLAGRQKYGAAMFGPSNFNIPPFNYYEAGPSMTWTPDLFGEDHYKIAREQAFARYQLHQLKALDLAVAGNTLSTAIDLACAHTEIAVLKKMKTGDKETLALIRQAYHNGSATRLDILSARNRLINDQALLPPIEQRLSLDRHMLSILAGTPPSRWVPIKLDLHNIKLPKALPVSLPSKLIRTRP
ncbi:MAG: TolC family protein, partial [Pseudomonadota bacterium]|nr:TolC family protein [Pseudomonadota bacterium]